MAVACERTPGAVVVGVRAGLLAEAAASRRLDGETVVVPDPPAPRVPRPPALIAASLALEFVVPLATPNPLNARPSTRQRIAGPRRQREAVSAALWAVGPRVPDWLPPPWQVSLVKLGGQAVDGDAVPGCLKAVRDAVACWLVGGAVGRGDEDPRIRWAPPWQEVGGKAGVRVRVRSGREGA